MVINYPHHITSHTETGNNGSTLHHISSGKLFVPMHIFPESWPEYALDICCLRSYFFKRILQSDHTFSVTYLLCFHYLNILPFQEVWKQVLPEVCIYHLDYHAKLNYFSCSPLLWLRSQFQHSSERCHCIKSSAVSHVHLVVTIAA